MDSKKNLFIETFGCQMNANDTEKILLSLGNAGYVTVETAVEADLILINTCSVRDKAEHKLYSTIGRYKAFKKNNPELVIGICGCVAEQVASNLLKRLQFVDLIIGTKNIHKLQSIIEDYKRTKIRRTFTGQAPIEDDEEFNSTLIEGFTNSKGVVKATLSIMRGCDNYCTYCIVPYVRGSEESRSPESILGDVEGLAKKGIKELMLLGQNVNSYAGINKISEKISFTELLKKICNVRGIGRVRFVTSHPKDISDELIMLFGSEDKLARHLHLPLQSGSDKVLEAMGRGYKSKEYMTTINKLRTLYPDLSLTSDIIVGFPGETEEDFSKTLSIVKEASFESVFSFKYSQRPGTKATEFADQVPEDVKKERLERLQSLQKEITAEKNHALVGSVVEVLIEGRSKVSSEFLSGRTECNRVINFPKPSDATFFEAGVFKGILVTEACKNSLRGKAVERSQPC
ncbi:MAG: tRNA (N6-isopentenyl adenosine(37)-C2)-methylthiotransferase MiaB [Deltaproteobacteria bacterium]|nr:tRNA (N6-isopentenyl adenosine(37)-C2)-methylthiotransferase MiaB [Deltaproteobacteria bacterium]